MGGWVVGRVGKVKVRVMVKGVKWGVSVLKGWVRGWGLGGGGGWDLG